MKAKPHQNTNSKAPPVPTLVRGSGSSLIGKKPTHLPDEVVKVRDEAKLNNE